MTVPACRAHSYAGDSTENFAAMVALAGRTIAHLGGSEVVHAHRHGEACTAGVCQLVVAVAPSAPTTPGPVSVRGSAEARSERQGADGGGATP